MTVGYIWGNFNFRLKFTNDVDNDYIFMWDVNLQPHQTDTGKIASGYKKNDKKWQWLQFGYNFGESSTSTFMISSHSGGYRTPKWPITANKQKSLERKI